MQNQDAANPSFQGNAEHFLNTHPLFTPLSDEDKKGLFAAVEPFSLPTDSALLKEGEASFDLYFLESGELEIQKRSKEGIPIAIGKIEAGNFVGEISFLDDRDRSASAICKTPCSGFAIRKGRIPKANHLIEKVQSNLAILHATQFRHLNDQFLSKLENEIVLLKEHIHFANLMLTIIVCVTTVFIATHLLDTNFQWLDVRSGKFGALYTLILIVPPLFIASRMGYPLSFFGLELRGAVRGFIKGLQIGIPLTAIMLLLNYFYTSYLGLPFFSKGSSSSFEPIILAYLPVSYIQELVGRGIMLNCLWKFIGYERWRLSVLFSSILFGILHLHLGIWVVFATFIGGLLLGYIYVRFRSLITCAVVHFLIGWAIFAIGF